MAFQVLPDDEAFADELEKGGVFCGDYLPHDALPLMERDDDFLIHRGDLVVDGPWSPPGTNVLITGDLRCSFVNCRSPSNTEESTISVGGSLVCDDLLCFYGVFLVVGGDLVVSNCAHFDFSDAGVVVRGNLKAKYVATIEIVPEVDGSEDVQYSPAGGGGGEYPLPPADAELPLFAGLDFADRSYDSLKKLQTRLLATYGQAR